MDSWRDIKESILWIVGFSEHPSYILDSFSIYNYLSILPVKLDMKPVGNVRIERVKDILLPDNSKCHGIHGFQLWKTSGVAIYVWEAGKISITIHSCKEFNTGEALKFTKAHFHLIDYDYRLFKSKDLFSRIQIGD